MMTDQRQSTDLATVAETDLSAVIASQNSKAVFLPANLAQAMELAHFMAGGIGVRPWMRGNPSACLALIQISMRWGLDPYIVANKAYYTNDTLAFESQLVNAVINTSGQLIGRLKIEFSGDASGPLQQESLICHVAGRLKADPDSERLLDQPLRDVKIRNSPIWKVNPKLQLAYHATRSWARLFMPEVLLGIYTPDEIVDGAAMRLEDQSEQRSPDAKAPDRRTFQEPAAEEAEFDEIETHLPEEDAARAEQESEPVDDELEQERAEDLPAAEPVDILDSIPTPLEFAAWRAAVEEAINAVTNRKEFDTLRRRIMPGLEQVDEERLTAVQDLLTDKLMALPEPEEGK